MTAIRFTATIAIHDGNPYVTVSQQLAGQLQPNWRRPMPVVVRINGKPKTPWRINMMPVGDGSFYLYLHGDVRKASATTVGDRVDIIIAFDNHYASGPQHPMPDWFARALADNPTAQTNWSKLPPSRQKEILRYFSWLKSSAAKQRNLTKALHVLAGNEGRFMARSWKNGK